MGDLVERWSDFNVAMVGATAALAGLLIVAMSVNIQTITASKSLPDRVAASLATLVGAIAVTALGLAPDQPTWVYGVEVLLVAGVATRFEVGAVRAILRDHERSVTGGERFMKSAAGIVPIAVYVAGGIALVVGGVGGAGGVAAGLWLIAIAAILAIASAILHAWIVLVEVLR